MTNPERRRAPRSYAGRLARTGSVGTLVMACLLALASMSMPALGAGALRIAVISDLNGSYGSTRYDSAVDDAVKRILELKPDLVISTGDMVAGQRRPHLSRVEIERMWSAFHAHVSDPFAEAGIPLAVTPGNHDGSAYHGFELERRVYADQWLPRKPALEFVDDRHYPFYFAFTAGNVLFISLDATTVGHLPRTQMDWVRQLLQEHGSGFERRVAFSHVPLWPFARGRESEYIGDPALEQLLAEADVDLYLSGHHHAFYPGHKDGIDLVSQSCLGAGPRRLIGTRDKSPRSFTLIELTADNTMLTAFREPGFHESIDWSTLPADIRLPAARLVRADLVKEGARQLVDAGPGQ